MAPCDGEEEGVEVGCHAINAGEEVGKSRFGFGREEFEGVIKFWRNIGGGGGGADVFVRWMGR